VKNIDKIDKDSIVYDNDHYDNGEIEHFYINDKDKDKFNNTVYLWYNNENKISKEKTKVIYGEEKTTELISQVLYNTNIRWDIYTNSEGLILLMKLEQLKKGMESIHYKGIKIKCISVITTHNINYCKELMKIAELRHLDDTKGWSAINETEYISTAHLQEAKPFSYLIYSNLQEIVEQQQLIFDGFWVRAVPAEQKIKEIEYGYERTETKVLDDQEEICSKLESLGETSDELLVCSDVGRLQMAHISLFTIYQKIMDKYNEGYHKGIRWITSINSKEDIESVKLFMNMGIKIRHIKYLPIINYLVNNKVFLSNAYETNITTIEKELPYHMLTSNDPSYINHYKLIFEDFWKNGIDAKDLIEDIERGVDPERIDIISRSNNVKNLYIDLLKSAKKEIMLIFPTTNAFLRQHKIGVTDAMLESATSKNISVRVLMPKSGFTIQTIDLLKKEKYVINNNKFEIRHIEQLLDTKATILIIDKKVSLVMELKDDAKDTFYDAIGLSTYSNSKAGVLSYVSVFENLWKQTELYQELEKANEQLKISETLQKDFIRIAVHELKNPIQPIFGLSGLLMSRLEDEKELYNIAKIIHRNAKKLIKLTDDVLDIAKIETSSLTLNKEILDLRWLLNDNINEYKNQIMIDTDLQSKYIFSNYDKKEHNNIAKLIFPKSQKKVENKNVDNNELLIAEVDKSRLSQIIFNLLYNAHKFTDENDTINVALEKESIDDKEYALITIKDTGRGIDPEIMPRLFTKFATTLDKGTGLGLFICKNIVEAHGGKIWGKNNEDGKGATFGFILPLKKIDNLMSI
jgi:two-component system, OmpR family, sensor histidine kinase VicK